MDKNIQDVWQEILKRIEAKDLGKCLCVCKTWYSLILSPYFITSHTKFHQTHLSFLLRSFKKASPTEIGKEIYHILSDFKEKTEKTQTLQSLTHKSFVLPFETISGLNFRVVGSVNGVIFLSDDNYGITHNCVIWNPLIKKYIKLPKPRINFDAVGPYMNVFGFGYDFKTQDYKVIRVSYIQLDSGLDKIPPKVEVFSVKLGVWKWVLADNVSICIPEGEWSQCFLQGCVHWLGFDRNEGVDLSFMNNCLLVFNVEEEKFGRMELPLELFKSCPLTLVISECRGLLSIEHCDIGGDKIEMWTQKEYGVFESWSKVLSVSFDVESVSMKVLWRRQNGEILGQTKEGGLVSYDSSTKNAISLHNDGDFATYCACSFMESLAFLEDPKSKSMRTILSEEEYTGSREGRVALSMHCLQIGRTLVLCNQMTKFRGELDDI